MKKLIFLLMASAFMFACSDSDDPSPVVDNSNPEGNVTFEISAVNKLSDGLMRGNVYSQEATQHITRVVVHAFVKSGADYVYARTYNIPGWTDLMTFKRYVVGDQEKLPQGEYKFLAIGRDPADNFNVTVPASGSSYSTILATIQNTGDETEIFAGTTTAQVLENGSRVSIEMTRKVAAVMGYFKNVPQSLNGTVVKFLRLSVSNSNQQVNLTNGVGINTASSPYNIIDMDLSGQTVVNDLYTGNDLSGESVVKVPNSQLSGSYLMPVSGVTLTLGLYDATNNPLKVWSVTESNGTSSFNITANHFYSLGMKAKAGNTNGGNSDPADDDDPIDLLTDQNIVVSISPNWDVIHNLVIQ